MDTAIGVVGAGRLGLGLAQALALRGNQVVVLTSLAERAALLSETRACPEVLPELTELHPLVEVTTDPAALVARAELVFVTVSRDFFPGLFDRVAPWLTGSHCVVHAVHRLEGASLERVSTRVCSTSAIRQVAVMAGPADPADLVEQRLNAVVVGSAFPALVRWVREVLASDVLRISGTSDINGVECAAALSQVVAVAVGLSDGLGLGAASHALVLTRGMEEAARVGARLGARGETFAGLAGVGRVIDGVRRGDPDYLLGRRFAETGSASLLAEELRYESMGLDVATAVAGASGVAGLSLPILRGIATVASSGTLDPVSVQRWLAESVA